MQETHNPDADRAVLADYGLTGLLAGGDDLALWAAAVREFWPALDSPALSVDTLRFGVGREAAAGEEPDARSAMVLIAEWAFERVEAGHLRPVPPPSPQPAANWGAPAPAGPSQTLLPPGFGSMGFPFGAAYAPGTDTIIVSRPSSVPAALVYHGVSGGGIGTGETRRWTRDSDGRWTMTDQRASIWLT